MKIIERYKFYILIVTGAVLACAGMCSPLYAQSSLIGSTTAKFLKVGLGGRSAGMGGAFTAAGEGVEAMFWNPAGMARTKDKELGISYNMWFEDISSGYAAYAQPLKDKKSVLGISGAYWNMGQIEVTSSVTNPPTIESYAAVSQGFAGLSFSYAFVPNFIIGISGKYIFQNLAGTSLNGGTADAGILYLISEYLRIGISGQNLVTSMQATGTGGTADVLPVNVKAGISVCPLKELTIALDAEKPLDNDLKIHAGVEYVFKEIFAVRAGYNQAEATTASGGVSDMAGISMGIGIKSGVGEYADEDALKMDVDYAYVPYGGLGTTHRLSLIMRF